MHIHQSQNRTTLKQQVESYYREMQKRVIQSINGNTDQSSRNNITNGKSQCLTDGQVQYIIEIFIRQFESGIIESLFCKKQTQESLYEMTQPLRDNYLNQEIPRKIKFQYQTNFTAKKILLSSKHKKRDDQQQLNLTLAENKSISKQHTNHKVPINNYNQLKDKNLVQYFYTKRKNLFHQTVQNKENQHFTVRKRNVQNGLKTESSKKPFFLKLIKNFPHKEFVVSQNCRKPDFNIFDVISCEQSLRKTKDKKWISSLRNSQQCQKWSNNKSQQRILKSRIVHLQSKVNEKVPFLVQLGVKFKTKHAKQ